MKRVLHCILGPHKSLLFQVSARHPTCGALYLYQINHLQAEMERDFSGLPVTSLECFDKSPKTNVFSLLKTQKQFYDCRTRNQQRDETDLHDSSKVTKHFIQSDPKCVSLRQTNINVTTKLPERSKAPKP